ncbi:beta-galactosidase YesZ [soil metagenome]
MTTVVGAQYYRPPNPPKGDWSRDLHRMSEVGFTTVKFWACWSWIEGNRGEYDFADLDELMDLAADAGLEVVINTILENVPYWLDELAPYARYTDHEGNQLHLTAAMNTPGGGWPGLCFDNEIVWEHAGAFLDALVKRFDGYPSMRVWDVWNEPHLEPASYYPERIYCYCDASVAAFTAWLQNKYESLDELNEKWSRRYSDWSQVEPPRLFEAVPDMLDWRNFWFDNLAAWLTRRTEIVRAASAGETTVMTHVALSGFTGELAKQTVDEFTLTGPVDAFGTSSFPTWLMGDDHVEHLMNLDTARDAAAGKPFWQAELQGGRGRRAGANSTAQPTPEVVRLWMWNSLAAGATGIMFWQWRPELLGPESPGYGLCAPDGETTERVDAASALARIAQLPELDDRTPQLGSTALLVSRLSALHAFAADHTMDLYTAAIMGAYRLLVDADVPFVFLHEDQIAAGGIPDHITSIYWPMPTVATPEVAEAVRGFVSGGGTLVAESAPGEYDELGRRRPTVPGLALADVFGLVEHETTVEAAPTVTLGDGGSLRGAWQTESLRLRSATTLGTFSSGAPGITTNQHGDGTAVLVATYPSVDYHSSRDAATRASVVGLLGLAATRAIGWESPGPGLVSRTATLPDGRTLVFAINWSTDAAKLISAVPLELLAADTTLAGTTAGSPVAIPARSGALFITVD